MPYFLLVGVNSTLGKEEEDPAMSLFNVAIDDLDCQELDYLLDKPSLMAVDIVPEKMIAKKTNTKENTESKFLDQDTNCLGAHLDRHSFKHTPATEKIKFLDNRSICQACRDVPHLTVMDDDRCVRVPSVLISHISDQIKIKKSYRSFFAEATFGSNEEVHVRHFRGIKESITTLMLSSSSLLSLPRISDSVFVFSTVSEARATANWFNTVALAFAKDTQQDDPASQVIVQNSRENQSLLTVYSGQRFRFCSCHKNFHPLFHFRGLEKTCRLKASSLKAAREV